MLFLNANSQQYLKMNHSGAGGNNGGSQKAGTANYSVDKSNSLVIGLILEELPIDGDAWNEIVRLHPAR